MFGKLRKWFVSAKDSGEERRVRLHAAQWPVAIYAIGDVHGCLELLCDLERKILSDAEGIAGEKWIVMLGDYIDRGPNSAGVLDHLVRTAPAGFRRICLAGNHEVMMLDYISAPHRSQTWLELGGMETLSSYGIDPVLAERLPGRQFQAVLHSHIPGDHLRFLVSLPVALTVPGSVFVHAGVRSGSSLETQLDEDLLWMRERDIGTSGTGFARVVHGHTPHKEPFVDEERIDLDTGAFATGCLTAVRLTEDGGYYFLTAQSKHP